MATRKTCDKCKHYTSGTASTGLTSSKYSDAGECALMGDSNDELNAVDRCAGWDYEGYRAGVYVGPKFGCIHWEKISTKE